MKLIYPAIFHKENDSYWAEFPDLIGCHSYGYTASECFINAQEALEGYAITLLEDGKKIPSARDISTIIQPSDGFVSLIESDISSYLNRSKAVKKTLTIPSWLNDLAISKGINFSETLQDALMRQLNMI